MGNAAYLALPDGSPAKAGVRTIAPGFSRGYRGSIEVGARFSGRERGTTRCMPEVLSPAKAGSRNLSSSHPPVEAVSYGSYAGFAGDGWRSING